LSATVSLEDWRAIVQAAVASAKDGDAKAREWLARYLLGEKPLTLTALAADEAAGLDAERDILESLADRDENRRWEERIKAPRYAAARGILGGGGKQARQPSN
jgi:hypothetical protein